MFKNFILSLLIAISCISAYSQDEIFSQFYAIPIHMNPALTGAYEGTYRLTTVYRDQWNNNLGSAYKTFAAGGDTRFQIKLGGKQLKDHFGVGLFFVSDRVTEFQASSNQISSYFAYHKKFGDRTPSYLGAGLKMGVMQRNINYDNLTFGDQFNQLDAFDQETQENLPPNNIGVFDVSLGLNYYVELKKTKYYVGFAAHHLTNPNISFFQRLENVNPNTDLDQKLESKYVFHISMDKELQYRLQFQPRIIYQKQAEDNLLSLGTNFQYDFKTADAGLVFGLWTSVINDLDGTVLDRVTPLVGIIKDAFIFGFSYDVSLRDTTNNPFNLNTFEFSIRFSGVHANDTGICPSF